MNYLKIFHFLRSYQLEQKVAFHLHKIFISIQVVEPTLILPPMQPAHFLRCGFPIRGEGNMAAELETNTHVIHLTRGLYKVIDNQTTALPATEKTVPFDIEITKISNSKFGELPCKDIITGSWFV